MNILTPNFGEDYQLLDTGNGQRLERFGKYILIRPDPQIIWKPSLTKEWEKADAVFKDRWIVKNKLPQKWLCKYQNISFWVKLSPFKHTGIFPEQATHWEFLSSVIANTVKQSSSGKIINQIAASPTAPRNDKAVLHILNLFGYTGIASLVAAKAGAKVTHVDASYPTIGWARENQIASKLQEKPIRWILDDCLKFVEREVKREVKYDGIIMDPPVYGHGPKGEIWDFNKSFPILMEACMKILSETPLFIIINAYAISTSSITLQNLLEQFAKPLGGSVESGELALKDTSNRLLSTGIFAKWSK